MSSSGGVLQISRGGSGGGMGVSNFSEGVLQFLGGSPIFQGVTPNLGGVLQFSGGGGSSKFSGGWSKFGGSSNFSGGVPPNFRGGAFLQIFRGGSPIFRGVGGLQFSEYGQRSVGTHPTGMHSCFCKAIDKG